MNSRFSLQLSFHLLYNQQRSRNINIFIKFNLLAKENLNGLGDYSYIP